MSDMTINTQWGELHFEDGGDEYMVFPAPDFVQCVLYDQVSGNEALIEAVNNFHLEQEPILWRESDEYGRNADAAYVDFMSVLEGEFGIPVLES